MTLHWGLGIVIELIEMKARQKTWEDRKFGNEH